MQLIGQKNYGNQLNHQTNRKKVFFCIKLLKLATWSLIIDPKLQDIKWIKEKEKDNGLTLLRMYNKKLINIVGECIEDDKTVILENLNEMIESKLSPIKGRNAYKKKFYEFGNNEN